MKSEKTTKSGLSSSGRIPVFKPQFREDLVWWAKSQPKIFQKALDLIEGSLEDPFSGIGKPEPLKYLDANTWSRRITQEHRLIYRITDDRIYFLQARYHYETR